MTKSFPSKVPFLVFEGTPAACSRLFYTYCMCLYVMQKPAAASASVHFLSVVPLVFVVKNATLDVKSFCENEDNETERITAIKDCR